MKVGSLVYFDDCGESLGYGVVVQMDSSRYKGAKVHWFRGASRQHAWLQSVLDAWLPEGWLTEVMT